MLQVERVDHKILPSKPIEKSKTASKSSSSNEDYQKLMHLLEIDESQFWDELISLFYFKNLAKNRLEYNIDVRKGNIFVNFLSGSRTNMAYNCLERNIERGLGSKVAYIWEGNDPSDTKTITYQELLDEVKACSNMLRAKGVKKGDVVAIFLPMMVELPVAILACARIGAIQAVAFTDLSPKSLAQRISRLRSRVIITCDGFFKGPDFVPTKNVVDEAMNLLGDHKIDHVIVAEHLKRITRPKTTDVPEISTTDKDVFWGQEMGLCRNLESPIEWVESEDPLFVLCSSGSTGMPKGIVHSTSATMVSAYHAVKTFFDLASDDTIWVTSHCGWVTGQLFGTYGALLNGATSIMFEGIPTYPLPGRFLSIIEKYQVTKLFTATHEIRSMMVWEKRVIQKHDLSSLKIVVIGGEKVLPQTWDFLYEEIGKNKIKIINGYGQTEMAGCFASLPYQDIKPGSVGLPILNVKPVILDDDGRPIKGTGQGSLCFEAPYFGMARTLWDDHQRFIDTYFSTFPGYYFAGDQAKRDEDGFYWVLGRIDDEIKIRGAKFSSHELDAEVLQHPDIAEAVTVTANYDGDYGKPYVFVILKHGKTLTEETIKSVKSRIGQKFGPLAVPGVIQAVENFPRTSTGKILRRVLIVIAEGNKSVDFGDMSGLANPETIEHLWKTRPDTI